VFFPHDLAAFKVVSRGIRERLPESSESVEHGRCADYVLQVAGCSDLRGRLVSLLVAVAGRAHGLRDSIHVFLQRERMSLVDRFERSLGGGLLTLFDSPQMSARKPRNIRLLQTVRFSNGANGLAVPRVVPIGFRGARKYRRRIDDSKELRPTEMH